jgi:hypothetical protein
MVHLTSGRPLMEQAYPQPGYGGSASSTRNGLTRKCRSCRPRRFRNDPVLHGVRLWHGWRRRATAIFIGVRRWTYDMLFEAFHDQHCAHERDRHNNGRQDVRQLILPRARESTRPCSTPIATLPEARLPLQAVANRRNVIVGLRGLRWCTDRISELPDPRPRDRRAYCFRSAHRFIEVNAAPCASCWPLRSARPRRGSCTAQRRQMFLARWNYALPGGSVPMGKNSSGSTSRHARR